MVQAKKKSKNTSELPDYTESVLQAILDSTPVNIVLLDKNYRIVCSNKTIRNMLMQHNGISISVGDDFRNIVKQPNLDIFLQSFAKAINGEAVKIEFLTANLKLQYNAEFNPFHDHEGKVSGVVFTAIDVDQWKKTEVALHQTKKEKEEAKYFLNERVKELATIYSINKILQDDSFSLNETFRTIVEIIPSGWEYTEVCEAKIMFDKNAYATNGYRKSQYSQVAGLKTHDGKIGFIEVVYTKKFPQKFEGPFLKEERDLINTLAEMFIVHYNKRLAFNELKTLNEELEQRVKQRTEELESFSYSVSHDLRAPLRAITGYLGMLEEDYKSVLDEEGKRLFGEVKNNAKRMNNMISDILTFSKLGQKELNKTLINMNEITGRAVDQINKTGSHRAEIKFNNLHPVMGDYSLMEHVMTNLLSNAIKYSSKKENPQVKVKSVKSKGKIIYSVSDNGAGFDMDYAHKLFSVFQRLHSFHEFPGTGVGLSIVRRIVQKHDGAVWAEGTVGKGATFFFSMPSP